MFKYFPHTNEDIHQMLEKIGVKSLDELFSEIPSEILLNRDYNVPSSHSELEIYSHINSLTAKNTQYTIFRGAGAYDVYVPSIISYLTSRQEFLTSYTPYQPEISQGTLQYIFEFQSMICELTGLDVANASMYDGPTATAESIFMATSVTRRNKVLLSSTLNPRVIEVVKTYAKYKGINIEMINEKNKVLDFEDLQSKLDNDVAAVVVGYPNFYGILEDHDKVRNILTNKELLIMNVEPRAMSVLKTPGEFGADIACGDGQMLGIPLSCGGPYVGFIAAKDSLLRKMPGRICGMTTDVDGKRGFVLTLQAREQHIRREKANSNICSNQSLMALHTVIYMSLMGKKGLQEVSLKSYSNAHYLHDELLKTNLFSKITDEEFFCEFVLRYHGDAKELEQKLLEHNILGGLVLDNNDILFCVTEKRTKEEMDYLVDIIRGDQ